MISRHRLRGRRAFDRVRARRASAGSATVRVAAAPNGTTVARIGFTVPRSAGGAVIRNRIRRRLRPLLASRLAGLTGLDVVVGAGATAATAPHAVLTRDLDRCLASATARLGGGRR